MNLCHCGPLVAVELPLLPLFPDGTRMNTPSSATPRWLAAAACAFLLACGGDTQPAADAADAADTEDPGPVDTAGFDDTASVDDTAADVEQDTTAPLCSYLEPKCSDQQIAALRFTDTPSGGDITEEGTVAGEFLSHIDATAGGFNGTLGYTYARFTDTGLVTVDISDEESLDDMTWDIALRRYIIRLNSGVSGPSCVTGGRTGPTTTWEGLTAPPEAITYHTEQYYIGEACEYVPEPSGIGSPQTVLSSFWSYPGCVAMTDFIYVVALRDGRHVKLQVLSYYDPDAQKTCNTTDAAPTPNGSGNIRMRWAFLD